MRFTTAAPSGITVGTTTITGGTSGAIPFNGAGVYQEDATQLFWDNTNNRLGIGTASPGQPLHVVGTDNLFSTYTAKFRSADNSKGIDIANNGVLFINTTTYNAVGINMEGSAWIKSTGSDMLDLMKSNGQYSFAFPNLDKMSWYVSGTVHGGITDGLLGIGTGGATPSASIHVIGLGASSATNNSIWFNSTPTEIMRLQNDGSLGLNLAGAPSAILHVKGSGATSATYAMKVQNSASADLFNVRNDGAIFTTTGIDTTAGDSATIDKASGRFRKDTTGTTFTLTNALITANSIVIITAANAAIDATATGWTVSAGAGSATITFNAAPTANFDMNFLVIN